MISRQRPLPLDHEAGPLEHIDLSKDKVHLITGHKGPEGEWRYSSTLSLNLVVDRGDSQSHALAALPPGKIRYPLCMHFSNNYKLLLYTHINWRFGRSSVLVCYCIQVSNKPNHAVAQTSCLYEQFIIHL